MVVRWASSHNNTFKLAVVAGKDEHWFSHEDFFKMFHDYIDSAPPGANEAVAKPRYHGSSGKSGYTDHTTYTACAGGYCVPNLFSREIPSTDPTCKFSFCFLCCCRCNFRAFLRANLFITTDLSLFLCLDIGHTLDMGSTSSWTHAQYEYNPDIVHNEGAATWDKIPDRRVCRQRPLGLPPTIHDLFVS